MFERINYFWRLFGTGVSFFLFGVVGVLFWGILFPLLDKFIMQGIPKKLRSRLLMNRIFHIYMEFMRIIGILTYEVHGGERLNAPGRLVIANHPSLLDVVFLISQIRNATCIVKPALATNPFMRIPIHAMGYIYADDPEAVVKQCAEELQEGCSLIVFPEGTRTTPGKPLKFLRGAATIALQSKAKILPVIIGCSPTTLTKREKWYQIPHKKFILSLYVGEDIEVDAIDGNASRSLATRKLTRQLEAYFIEGQAHYGRP
jgi:1-acyl-sn-glycerol-3-phosphate acyltransferase